jgi:hypothetical protein
MLADKIIPTTSETEVTRINLFREKKKIPKTIGIFKYKRITKKGSNNLFAFSCSVYFSSLF